MLIMVLKPEKYELDNLDKRFVLAKLILVILRVTLSKHKGVPEILGNKISLIYRPELPNGLQEVKVPRLRDSGPECW